MSIRVMTMVLDCPHVGGGSELLALLAIADWSDDDGRCYPSMSTAAIARKLSLEPLQAQRIVHQLIEAGFLSVSGNEKCGYVINLSKLREA